MVTVNATFLMKLYELEWHGSLGHNMMEESDCYKGVTEDLLQSLLGTVMAGLYYDEM